MTDRPADLRGLRLLPEIETAIRHHAERLGKTPEDLAADCLTHAALRTGAAETLDPGHHLPVSYLSDCLPSLNPAIRDRIDILGAMERVPSTCIAERMLRDSLDTVVKHMGRDSGWTPYSCCDGEKTSDIDLLLFLQMDVFMERNLRRKAAELDITPAELASLCICHALDNGRTAAWATAPAMDDGHRDIREGDADSDAFPPEFPLPPDSLRRLDATAGEAGVPVTAAARGFIVRCFRATVKDIVRDRENPVPGF